MLDVWHTVFSVLFFFFFSGEFWESGLKLEAKLFKIKNLICFLFVFLFCFFHFRGTEKGGQSASDVTNTTVCVHVRTSTHTTTHTCTLSLLDTQTHTHFEHLTVRSVREAVQWTSKVFFHVFSSTIRTNLTSKIVEKQHFSPVFIQKCWFLFNKEPHWAARLLKFPSNVS